VPNVELQINGQKWVGWQKIRIVQSIKQASNGFTLSLADRWEYGQAVMPIQKGQSCQVLVDGILLVTGYLVDVNPDYDNKGHQISVSGYSKAIDLVDCSTAGMQFNGRTLLQIAQALAGPFGIGVTASADIGAAFPAVAIEPGESIFEFLNKLSRVRAVRLVSMPDGSVSFVQTGTAVSPTALVFGENILRATAMFSSQGDFSAVSVVSQMRGTDDNFGDAAAVINAGAVNAAVRYRPLTVIADGPANAADCKNRAQAELNRRAGEGQAISYTVQGWYNADALWAPNVLVDVVDPLLNVNARLLVAEVVFEVDDQAGFITLLDVRPPAAFDLAPLSMDAIPDVVKVRKSVSKRARGAGVVE